MHKEEEKYCSNCHYPLAHFAKYCSKCGQKRRHKKITLKELISEFFSSFFNWDSKIFQSVGALFFPGRLTNNYFNGKHGRYVPPIRLFLVSALIFFALLNFKGFSDEIGEGFSDGSGIDDFFSTIRKEAYREQFLIEVNQEIIEVDTLFKDKKVSSAMDSLRVYLDIDNLNKDTSGLDFHLSIGGTSYNNKDDSSTYYSIYNDKTKVWGMPADSIQIAKEDLLLPIDSLSKKYNIENFQLQWVIQQNQHFLEDGGNFINYFFGQLVWMILLMMPVLALIFKILYIRRNYYYVEHLIFSFHCHTFVFVILSLFTLLSWITVETGLLISFLLILIYLYLAMKNVYKQGQIKTFFKFSVLSFSYALLFIIFLSLTLAISALIF